MPSTSLSSGEYDPNWDAGLRPVAKIGDLVWADANADGIQDSEETGISGVTVRLFDADNGAEVATTVTDDGGKYAFAGLTPGNYQHRDRHIPAGFTASPQGPGFRRHHRL